MTVPGVASRAMSNATSQSSAPLPAPPPEIILLNRIGFGPRPGDGAVVNGLGVGAYIEEQLNPESIDDAVCDAKIATQGFQTLGLSVRDLWARKNLPNDRERYRAYDEVFANAWLRAIWSRRQLYELLVDHWHNHFNVNIDSYPIYFIWPDYDRRIRANVFGNFRTFLEDIATSPAMLYYLDNASSTAAGPNENWARELFELHTLGVAAYTPGIQALPPGTVVPGYRDWDVYEAARCFTGWTIRDQGWDPRIGDTGEFMYRPEWHDRFQKYLLNAFIPPDQAPMKDGRDVLDRVAFHPATARNVATRLARRLVSDTPSDDLISKAAKAFLDYKDAPDQLRHVYRAILTHPTMLTGWGQKVKRPFEAMVGALRATNTEWKDIDEFWWWAQGVGQELWHWAAPNGYPDFKEAWGSSVLFIRRWNFFTKLCDDGFGNGAMLPDLLGQTPAGVVSPRQLVQFWVPRILGYALPDAMLTTLYEFVARGRGLDLPLSVQQRKDRVPLLVALILSTPQFQAR